MRRFTAFRLCVAGAVMALVLYTILVLYLGANFLASSNRTDSLRHPFQKNTTLSSFLAWQRTLESRERKVFSQQGEDGVLETIFEYIGTTDKYYVEFDAESGVETNTRYLLEQKGWSGLLMDGGNENPSKNLHKEVILPSNIVELFEKYRVSQTFDLLSIDIDSYDLWVWRRLLKAGYRPRVVVVEFNMNFELGCYRTFPDPTGAQRHTWTGDAVMGASLDALDLLARQHGGYVLVYTDRASVNAFFLREDLLPRGVLEALPLSALHRGVRPLHARPTRSREELLVDYLEWSKVYDQPPPATRRRSSDVDAHSECASLHTPDNVHGKGGINQNQDDFHVSDTGEDSCIIQHKLHNKAEEPAWYPNNISVIICGIAHNISPHFSRVRGLIDKTAAQFNSARVFIYENDSTDDTASLLKQWNKENVTVLSETLGMSGALHSKDRTKRLAAYRNKYVDFIQAQFQNKSVFSPDLVIVVDMDLANWSPRRVWFEAISIPYGQAICANGIFGAEDFRMYDSYAYRSRTYDFDPETISSPNVRRCISPNEGPIEVKSCFNGMAIYPARVFESCQYNGDGDCEHVSLHRCMDYVNVSLRLQSRLVVSYFDPV